MKIDTGLYTHAIEHVNDVFGSDVAGCAGRIRTAAETGQGGIDDSDAELQSGQDVGERLTPGVVKMDGETVQRDMLRDRGEHPLHIPRSADTDGVTERDFIAAHLQEFTSYAGDGFGRD